MAEIPVTQRIQSLSNGISKQGATMRYPNQVADAVNINFSVTDGAIKRRGSTSWIVDDTSADIDPYGVYRMHRIERDETEEYMLVYGTDGYFKVWDVNSRSVSVVTGTDDYISVGHPKDLSFQTIADTTIVTSSKTPAWLSLQAGYVRGNKNVVDHSNAFNNSTMPRKMVRTAANTFEMSEVDWPERPYIEQMVGRLLGQGSSSSYWKLKFRGEYTLPFDHRRTRYEKDTHARSYGRIYHIPHWAEASRFVSGDDGHGIKQYLEELRTVGQGKTICTGGPIHKAPVTVEFSPNLETEGQNLYSTNGSYSVQRGNDDNDYGVEVFHRTDAVITDIAYFRGRLVLAVGDWIIMSRVNELYNFWHERPSAVADDDRIEVQIASDDVATITQMIPWRNSLLILTKQGRQYMIEDTNVLTPSTCTITPTTFYNVQDARCGVSGGSVYMAAYNPISAPILEYSYDDAGQGGAAVDITKHVPGLLPANIAAIATSSSQQMVVVVPEQEVTYPEASSYTTTGSGDWSASIWSGGSGSSPQSWDNATIADGHTVVFTGYVSISIAASTTTSKLFVYKYFNNGPERIQSAWTTWDMGTDTVLDAQFIDDDLYLLRRSRSAGSGLTQLVMDKIAASDFESPTSGYVADNTAGEGFEVHLDMMGDPVTATSGAEISLSYKVNGSAEKNDQINVAVSSSGEVVAVTSSDNTTFTGTSTEDPATSRTWILGRQYSAEITLSEVMMRGEDGTVSRDGRLVIDKMYVDHTKTGSYDVKITNGTRAERVVSFNPTDGIEDVGTKSISGVGEATTATIKLHSNSPEPVRWNSIEYHGRYSTNTR